MTAGNTFGLTKNGIIYAKSGQIGSMTIGDLNSRVEGIVGQNLVLNSRGPHKYEVDSSTTTPKTAKFELTKALLNNTTYVASFDIEPTNVGKVKVRLYGRPTEYTSNMLAEATIEEVTKGRYHVVLTTGKFDSL
jgi:hypothetical protein